MKEKMPEKIFITKIYLNISYKVVSLKLKLFLEAAGLCPGSSSCTNKSSIKDVFLMFLHCFYLTPVNNWFYGILNKKKK